MRARALRFDVDSNLRTGKGYTVQGRNLPHSQRSKPRADLASSVTTSWYFEGRLNASFEAVPVALTLSAFARRKQRLSCEAVFEFGCQE